MITDLLLFPALFMLFGALVLPLMKQEHRAPLFLLFPALVLVSIWTMPESDVLQLQFADYTLTPVTTDALSRIFGTIFGIIAFIGGIYSFHMKELGQQTSALAYAGGAIGVTFAGDWFTFLIFWELMAVSSTYLIWASRTQTARNAGMRYLIYHSLGGGLLLSGIVWHILATGSLEISSLPEVFTAPNVLILTGIAINTALPPLHSWLPDAYPRATITGAVFMSAFTTKSAVYALIRVFPGWELLLWMGVIMALYGVIYAIIANDIREILSYHIISQVGFMVAGVGVGTELALNGSTAHAFSHILYKALLFMGAGGVLYSTGQSKLSELGGLASRMKLTLILYMIGAFSISGLPLFNGFISKSMVISGTGEAHYEWGMLLLLMASVGTFLSVGLKLPYLTWFGKPKKDSAPLTVTPLPKNMTLAMMLASFLCILFGVYPQLLYAYLPYPVDYHPYTAYHLVETVQYLSFTFIGFWLLRHKFKRERHITLDMDWFYRRPAPAVNYLFVRVPDMVFGWFEDTSWAISRYLAGAFRKPAQWINPFTSKSTTSTTYSPETGLVLGLVLLCIIVAGVFLMV